MKLYDVEIVYCFVDIQRQVDVSEIVDRYLVLITVLRQDYTDYFITHAEALFGMIITCWNIFISVFVLIENFM